MSSSHSQPLSDQQVSIDVPDLELIAEEFVSRLRAGQTPSISEYTKRYPAVANEIRECFPAMAALEGGKFVNHSDGKVSLGSGRPQQLGDFKIIKEIGRGGMGVVYEAIQESLNRRVAVKVLPRHALLDPKQLKRFQREAEIAASLHHTNIVPVFGVGENDGFHYYVMQLIDGIGLDELLQKIVVTIADSSVTPHDKNGSALTQMGDQSSSAGMIDVKVGSSTQQLESKTETTHFENYINSPQEVATLGIQAANALQYAHDRGILHRDIKPGNLLLDDDGLLCITDFGLARATEQNDMSKTTDVVGTLGYMAPEMFRSATCLQSDIYGLGITLYELLTHHTAIERTLRHQMIEQITQGSVTPLRRINPVISRDLETIILKSIAADIAHRYQNASELADDLQRYLENRPIKARRVTPVERLWRWSRRNPVVAMLSGFACLLMLLLGVSLAVGFQRERDQRKRAEASSQLATAAVDRVFDRFVPHNLHVPGSTSLTGDQSQPLLSRDSAALLAEMVQFYEQLAESTGDQQEFQIKAASAQRKVGDIHQQLGDFQSALGAYQKSLQLYQRNRQQSDELTIATLLNETGRIHRRLGQRQEATTQHLESEKILQAAIVNRPSQSTCQFELARTYFLMGQKIRGEEMRRGGSSSSEKDEHQQKREKESQQIRKAISILDKLTTGKETAPQHRYLQALCLQELVSNRLPLSKEDQETQQRVFNLLEQLVEEYPHVAGYRQALVQSYESIDFRDAPRDLIETSFVKQLQKAVKHANRLVSDFPTIPRYKTSLIHSHNKLAHVLEELPGHESSFNEVRQRHDNAELSRRAALRLQKELVDQFPESQLNQMWLAKFQISLAAILKRKGGDPEAKELLEKALVTIEAELKKKSFPSDIYYDARDATEELARIYREEGEESSSKQMWAKVDQYEEIISKLPKSEQKQRSRGMRHPREDRHPPDGRRPPPPEERPRPPFRR